jgi:4'-phosphopantetheinyl transferase
VIIHPPAAGPELRAQPAPADVWLYRVDVTDTGAVPAADSWLSAAERARAQQGPAALRIRRVLLRAALRRALGDVLGLHPADVPLTEQDGRPSPAGAAAGPHLDVSCSASAGLGLVAVAVGARVGVDVERLDGTDLADGAAEGWLTARERAALAGLPAAVRPPAVTRCWTQKEAVLKGLGVGLRAGPHTVETPVSGAGTGWSGDWHLLPVDVPPGWVASLALSRALHTAPPLRPALLEFQ